MLSRKAKLIKEKKVSYKSMEKNKKNTFKDTIFSCYWNFFFWVSFHKQSTCLTLLAWHYCPIQNIEFMNRVSHILSSVKRAKSQAPCVLACLLSEELSFSHLEAGNLPWLGVMAVPVFKENVLLNVCFFGHNLAP